jgi:hypothetical protein
MEEYEMSAQQKQSTNLRSMLKAEIHEIDLGSTEFAEITLTDRNGNEVARIEFQRDAAELPQMTVTYFNEQGNITQAMTTFDINAWNRSREREGSKSRRSLSILAREIIIGELFPISGEIPMHQRVTDAAPSITCLSPVEGGTCGAPAVWFDYQLGEKEFYKGFVCDAHKVSNRVEKLAQPQIQVQVAFIGHASDSQ